MSTWNERFACEFIHLPCQHLTLCSSAGNLEKIHIGAGMLFLTENKLINDETKRRVLKSQSHILMGYHCQWVLQDLINDSTQLFCLLSELGRGAHLK